MIEGSEGSTKPVGVEYWSSREKLAWNSLNQLDPKTCVHPELA